MDNVYRRHMANSTNQTRSPFVDYDYLIKVVVVGDSGVGKSQLVARFTRNEFSTNSRQTIGVEFATKTIKVESRSICAQLWDTAGEERYRALASAYYRGAVGVLLVYDVTNMKSYQNIAHWLSEIKAYTLPTCQVLMVGNKIDLKGVRKITEPQAKTFASSNGMKYVETSALECTNVADSFTTLVHGIYKNTIEAKLNRNNYDDARNTNKASAVLELTSESTTMKYRAKCCGTT
nr:ras-related protein RABA2a-like [Ciona intestinalis]|eukprot:XP_002128785.1 ras-related protein RABA2a-like [Ciona intestinalis]